MSRDRRRGKKRYQAGSRPGPAGQQPHQPAAPSGPVASEKAPAAAKSPPPVRQPGSAKGPSSVKQPVLANPHLGRDLRNIGMVTAALVVLLIILWLVL